MTVADYNGDGFPDLARPIPQYYGASTVEILVNKGAGK